MLKSFQILFLSLSLVMSGYSFATDIPPGAVQVSPEEMRELKKKADEEKEKEKAAREVQQAEDDHLDLPLHVGAHVSSGTNSNEMAILIFAVVGTIVVFAWIPYAVLLVYRGIKHPENYKFRSMLTAQYNRFLDSGDVERVGNMSGLRYTTFIENRQMAGLGLKQKRFYGINAEVGNYHFNDIDEITNRRIGYDSRYWLLGPVFIYGDMRDAEAFFFRTDFLAGSSFKRDVDLILRAELTLNFKFPSGMVTGFGFGGNYLQGENGRGVIKYADELSTHWLFNLGYLF